MKYLKYILLMLVFVGTAEGQTMQTNAGSFLFGRTGTPSWLSPVNLNGSLRFLGSDSIVFPNGSAFLTSSSFNLGISFNIIGGSNSSAVYGGHIQGLYLRMRTGYSLESNFSGSTEDWAQCTAVINDNDITGSASTSHVFYANNPIKQSGTAGFTQFDANITRNSVGSGNRNFFRGRTDNVEKFSVNDSGLVYGAAGFSSPTGGVTSKFVKTDSLQRGVEVRDTAGVVTSVRSDSVLIMRTGVDLPVTVPFSEAAQISCTGTGGEVRFGKVRFTTYSKISPDSRIRIIADTVNNVHLIMVSYVVKAYRYGNPVVVHRIGSYGLCGVTAAVVNGVYVRNDYAYVADWVPVPYISPQACDMRMFIDQNLELVTSDIEVMYVINPGSASTYYVKIQAI